MIFCRLKFFIAVMCVGWQVQFSVMGATHPVKSLRDLVDPRLGLPAEEEKCLTCGGTTYENCTGWNHTYHSLQF